MSSYIENAADAVTDVIQSCGCCLRCAPDRDLGTPYTHLGETEIYSDMLKECFNLHLGVGGDGSCGICSACVGRLRDARDFKLQVQRSQAELQARLQGALRVKEEEPAEEPEMQDGEGSSEAPPSVKPEVLEGGGTGNNMLHEEPRDGPRMAEEDDEMSQEQAVKSEKSGAVSSDEDCISLALDGGAGRPVSALAREQLAMTCCVRLERLRGDEAPHASRTSLATLHESRRASRVQEPHDNTAGLRAEEAYTCDTCGKHFTGKSSLIAHVRSHLVQDESAATYSSGICSEQFSSENLFPKHTQAHTGQKTYSCDMCNKQFSAKTILIRHIKTHMDLKRDSSSVCNKTIKHRSIHIGEKPYRCDECNKEFTRKPDFDRHQRIHTGIKSYRCEECNKHFSGKSHLIRHKRIHTGEKPYMCEQCNKQFTQKSHLDRHQSIHKGIKQHSCEEYNKQLILMKQERLVAQAVDGVALDGGAGRPVSALAREQLAMTCCVRLERLRGDEAPHASRTSLATLHESRRASRVQEPHDNTAGLRAEEAYTCDTCGKHFTRKSSLIAHVRSHLVQDESAATYSRGPCSERFSCENLFPKHTHAHTGEKTYSCDLCSKQFNWKGNLVRHIKIHMHDMHLNLYSCGVCNNTFKNSSDLKRHKLIHTGEKPYSCKECSKQFTQKCNLDRHQRIHTGEQPYTCEACNKRFNEKQHLTKHKRIHTGEKPYRCEECNKHFSAKETLTAHKRIHTVEKPYRCEECNKQFSSKYTLDIHKRMHTKVRPYTCEECNKPFKTKAEVVRHRKVHTEHK